MSKDKAILTYISDFLYKIFEPSNIIPIMQALTTDAVKFVKYIKNIRNKIENIFVYLFPKLLSKKDKPNMIYDTCVQESERICYKLFLKSSSISSVIFSLFPINIPTNKPLISLGNIWSEAYVI